MDMLRAAMLPLVLAWLPLAGGAALHAQSPAAPSLVVLVRHGEKAAVPGDDPPLSAAGEARARALDSALAHLVPSAIIVSARRRTAETAAAVRARTGVTPTVVPLEGGAAAHVQAVVRAVRAARGTVLVVGHSNTIPAIVTALGGPVLPDLCDASYATLFLVQPSSAADGRAVVVRAQYGAPDPPGAASCPGMTPR
jgi:phosphohistidine phosphatase SixA